MAKMVYFSKLMALLILASCDVRSASGILRVNSLIAGQFEIYRMEGDPPSQLVSERVGKFNEDLPLKAGSYLVLADCSYEKIVVKSGQTQALTVHRVSFKPTQQAKSEDNFSVQCSRFEAFQFRQNLKNRFEFDVLNGKRELLVGMKPFTLDFGGSKSDSEPKQLTVELSALQVTNPETQFSAQDVPYFVTPSESLISVTQPQQFGHWQFLLPGNYEVEVNGTHKLVTLNAGESLSIDAAMVKLNAPSELSLDEGTRILGSPVSATINDNHLLGFNETIPVLPGPATIQISGSKKIIEIVAVERELTEISMRSLTIELGCSPWEWTCLGSQAVQLFDGEQHYPYLELLTDVPIMFPEQDVYVGLLTSAGLRYKLPATPQNIRLQAGRIRLIPRPIYRPGQITDLVRIESSNKLVSGHSRDIAPSGATAMILIAGEYRLAQYHSSTTLEGERWIKAQEFTAVAGETITLEFPFYVSERAFKKLSAVNVRHERHPVAPQIGVYQNAKPARSF